jgi:hypothetical protein
MKKCQKQQETSLEKDSYAGQGKFYYDI